MYLYFIILFCRVITCGYSLCLDTSQITTTFTCVHVILEYVIRYISLISILFPSICLLSITSIMSIDYTHCSKIGSSVLFTYLIVCFYLTYSPFMLYKLKWLVIAIYLFMVLYLLFVFILDISLVLIFTTPFWSLCLFILLFIISLNTVQDK